MESWSLWAHGDREFIVLYPSEGGHAGDPDLGQDGAFVPENTRGPSAIVTDAKGHNAVPAVMADSDSQKRHGTMPRRLIDWL
jgi:hypothetical protein